MEAVHARRSGDLDTDFMHAFRKPSTERFFQAGDLFYFATREGLNVGPFASKSTAQRALELYKYMVNDCSASGTYASQVVTRL